MSAPLPFRIDGRTALVTGGGQGMGREIAEQLAGRGAAVIVNDLYPERAEAVAAAIRATGGRARAVPADLTDPGAVRAMARDGAAAVGPIDILVYNAGNPDGWREYKPFREMDEAEWEPFIRLNLYGLLHTVRAVVDGMCERGWGRIVTIASEAGRYGVRDAGVSVYGGAKAGAIGFLRHLALELDDFGVTVNMVSPGLVAGPNYEQSGWVDPAKGRSNGARRIGVPEDIAAAVLYFVSDEASWVSGQVLPVNGGSRNG